MPKSVLRTRVGRLRATLREGEECCGAHIEGQGETQGGKTLRAERRGRKRAELRRKAEEERQEREEVAQEARHEQEQLAKEAQLVQVEAASSVEANTNRERRANKHIPWRSGGTIVAITAIALTIYLISRGSDLGVHNSIDAIQRTS